MKKKFVITFIIYVFVICVFFSVYSIVNNMSIEESADIVSVLESRPTITYSKNITIKSLDQKYTLNDTLLHIAIKKNHQNLFDIIMKHKDIKQVINIVNNEGKTPLLIAAETNPNFIKPLINHGAIINVNDKNGNSLTHILCKISNSKFLQTFIEDERIDLTQKNANGDNILHTCIKHHQLENMTVLLKKPSVVSLINNQNNLNKTPLFLATERNQHDTVKTLMKYSPNINIKCGKNNQTALMLFIINNNINGVKTILANTSYESQNFYPKKTFTSQDKANNSVLHMALEHTDQDLFTYIVKHAKPYINECLNNNKETPLHTSIIIKKDQYTRILIEHMPDVNTFDQAGYTPLMHACKNNNLEIIDDLINHNADVDIKNKNHISAITISINNPTIFKRLIPSSDDMEHLFIESCRANITEICKALTNPKYINKRDQHKSTALHYAILNNNIKLTQHLLDNGADVNIKDKDGNTALHLSLHHPDICKQIINHKPNKDLRNKLNETAWIKAYKNGGDIKNLLSLYDIDTIDKKSETALHYAIQNEDHEMIDLLLEKGSNVNMKTYKLETPLHLATMNQDFTTVKKLLEHKPNNINSVSKNNKTPLFIAIENENLDLCKLLIHHGADVNIPCTREKLTPIEYLTKINSKNKNIINLILPISINKDPKNRILGYAEQNNNIELIDKLINVYGINPNTVIENKNTLLHRAVIVGNLELCKLLVNQKDIQLLKDNKGRTPFHYAIMKNNIALCKTLINHVRKDEITNQKKTAMHLACEIKEHNTEIINWLLKNGFETNLNRKDKQNNTPLLYAIKYSPHIVELLMNRGSLINQVNKQDKNLLFFAVETKNINLIKLLIDKKIDVNKQDSKGFTVLHNSIRLNNDLITKLLLDANSDYCIQSFYSKITPLHMCIQIKNLNPDILNIIMNNRTVNQLNKNNENALHLAFKYDVPSIIPHLLDCGVDIFRVNKRNETILHTGIRKNRVKCVEALFKQINKEQSTQLNSIHNKLGDTPLQYAFKNKKKEIISIIAPSVKTNKT